MKPITINNVECYGDIKEADCVLVSTCEDSFTISPQNNWTNTVNHILKDDEYMQECAKRGELQIEVS